MTVAPDDVDTTLPYWFLDREIRRDDVTLGKLYPKVNDFGVFTLERPWKDNQQTISCIPTGVYLCKRSMYYGGDGVGGEHQDYECFQLQDVPNRTEIKIHIGNYIRNVVGCIVVGLSRDENVPAVWRSADAFEKFMRYNEGVDQFYLEVHNV